MIRQWLIMSCICLLCHSGVTQPYFEVTELKNAEKFYNGIARTMHLLETSTAQIRNEVRILVYGQSISVQDWWKELKRYFDSSYPSASIVFLNKAIGGFSSERLKYTVDNDVVSFYPDLILFHDYGNEEDYERIVQVIRSRTTSEIALQTDHMAIQNQAWHDKHSADWLPQLARKYGLAWIDIRTAWKEYLAKNNLQVQDLLTDGVHLNDHGNYLKASIMKNYFKGFRHSTVTDSSVMILKTGIDFNVANGSTELSVYGNRVDLIWKNGKAAAGTVSIAVDGKKPSGMPACYYYTRPAVDTAGFFLRKIGQPVELGLDYPIEEEWKMTITSTDSVKQQVRFRLQGSITGEDGSGSSDRLFVSNSKRIRIRPESWFRATEFAGFPWLKPDDVLAWQVKRMCADEVNGNANGSTTVLQGIDNGEHRLKLTGKGLANLSGIRIYRPPIPATALHKKEHLR